MLFFLLNKINLDYITTKHWTYKVYMLLKGIIKFIIASIYTLFFTQDILACLNFIGIVNKRAIIYILKHYKYS